MKSFSVASEVLQKHAYKDSVRNLNAEFQRAGGKVVSKSLKGGMKIQLSHPDDEFLDDFRIKLLDALGILPEEEAEALEKEKKKAKKKDPDPIELDQEDRGDLGPVKEIIKGALADGAIDDGQIIKYAYQQELDAETIDKLRSELITHRCRNPEFCPHKRKRIKFEDAMKSCLAAKEKCKYLSTDYIEFFDTWLGNVHEMFSEFEDKTVGITGKVSHYRFVARGEAQTHFRILLFDTVVRDPSRGDKGEEGKETRKIWIKVAEQVFDDFDAVANFCLGDIVKVQGRLQWNKHFGEYQVNQVDLIEVEEKGDGIRIEKIPGPMIGPNYKPEQGAGEEAASSDKPAEAKGKDKGKEKEEGRKEKKEKEEGKEKEEDKKVKKEKEEGKEKEEEPPKEEEPAEKKKAAPKKKAAAKKAEKEKEEEKAEDPKEEKAKPKKQKKGKEEEDSGEDGDPPEEGGEGEDAKGKKKGKGKGKKEDFTQGVSIFD